jgi:rhamnosyltransferase subunit B
MHAILTPVGSAGDVNPFIVVGRELRRRGHRVTVIGPELFGGVASNAGLGFVPVGTIEDYDRTTKNPDLWDPQRGLKIVLEAVTEQLQAAYAAVEQVYEPGQTMLVGHSLAFASRAFEETHDVAAATVHLAPSIFRSLFAQPALPSGRDITSWPRPVKRMLWWAVDRFLIDRQLARPLNAWRAGLGLPPVSRVFKAWLHSPQRVIGLFPDWFGAPQPDWPAQVRLTGFVLSDESCAPPPAAREPGPDDGRPAAAASSIARFLAGGDPPIVFTPGSANRHAAQFFRAGIDATARLGRRALLVTGHREQLPASLPDFAFHASYASFATLFPRALAVVHHGGIGTTAQGLAAGVPQLLMPMGFDQPDNAMRAVRLGVARALAPRHFTADRVAAALGQLVSSDEVAAACRRWRERIDSQQALACTCDLLEEQFAGFAGRRS